MPGETMTPLRMLGRLVAFDTTSSGSNLALIDYVRSYLSGHGVEARLSHDEAGAKANLLAAIGPRAAGGVVLSGHTDVVPTAGQAWASDPFTLTERDGRLYGRGAADMKGFLAVALALVPEMLARELKVPIYLALSFDEEVGCLGVPHLIRQLEAELPKPGLAIVGEPTAMKVAGAHKGIYAFLTTVTGRVGHSSAPERGVNAVMVAAELIACLSRLAEEMRAAAPAGSEFEPPHDTINVGLIEGGTAINIIPGACSFRWEHRPLPESDPGRVAGRLRAFAESELLPAMAEVSAEAGIATQETCAVPPLTPEPGSPAESLALTLTGQNRAGVVSFASEAGIFQRAGIAAVLIGPGDIAQAHQPNEFVDPGQLDSCAAFLRRLIDWAGAEG